VNKLLKTEIIQSIPEYTFGNLIGYSDIKREAMCLAKYDVDILIIGETGVGKEVLANAIHNGSPRKHKRLMHLDCSTIPSSLLESELFGYKKGAFTDAKEDRVGKIEYAAGGTVFLDEIGNITLETQAKILRVIENKDLCRIGENIRRSIDIRFIFASNSNLVNSINTGMFRKDLYYRINFHVIKIPPLRKRKNEIPKIVKYYWEKWNKEQNFNLGIPNGEEIETLLDYDYPGNIRELIGLLQRVYIAAVELKQQNRLYVFKKEIKKLKPNCKFKSLNERVKEYVREVVSKSRNLSEAARTLGIDRKTIRKKLR